MKLEKAMELLKKELETKNKEIENKNKEIERLRALNKELFEIIIKSYRRIEVSEKDFERACELLKSF